MKLISVAITGSSGFIGKNLKQRFAELENFDVRIISHKASIPELTKIIKGVDAVYHLAGVNRPDEEHEFMSGNIDFTNLLLSILKKNNSKAKVIFSSSTQVNLRNAYGESKLKAENVLIQYSCETGSKISILRLPNVFGKWCLPNYNSVVSTFCFNLHNGIPLMINDPSKLVDLIYIDDLIDYFVKLLNCNHSDDLFRKSVPVTTISIGKLEKKLKFFKESRANLIIGHVGKGFDRALYSTFMSYMPPEQFAYSVPTFRDQRGTFVEMLKTQDSGQFSFFTAEPNATRGEHYHHTKSEKFLVVSGTAMFKMRNILTDEIVTYQTNGTEGKIIETIPGWAHNITNIGDSTLVLMLWANEIFDSNKPDTIQMKVDL